MSRNAHITISSGNLAWSKGVVTNYGEGGGYKTGGGAHEVLPLQKGGAEKF